MGGIQNEKEFKRDIEKARNIKVSFYSEAKDIVNVVQKLEKDGLSLDKLQRLSYHSDLGIHLKKNLHYFDRESLFDELDAINGWYDSCIALHDIVTDYCIKSIQSARLKYEKYYPDHQARKVFDDMLGFRALCDNYEDVLALGVCENIRVADLSGGKANDVGCLALQTEHGQHLVELKKKLISEIGAEKIQLVTISRPSAYGEYEPYRFVDTEQEFEKAIKSL